MEHPQRAVLAEGRRVLIGDPDRFEGVTAPPPPRGWLLQWSGWAAVLAAILGGLWVIACAATYGAQLARAVTAAGYQVVEAARMNAKANRGVGKSDPLDARRIATAVLPLRVDRQRHLRKDGGTRAALRILMAARDHMTSVRTADINTLTALHRVLDLGIDARKPSTSITNSPRTSRPPLRCSVRAQPGSCSTSPAPAR